jgi:hypothetical protein
MKKEKIATISCFTICIITTIAVLNQVLVQDIDFERLFSMLGMVFVFFSMACTPWMFFKPINEIFSKLHSSKKYSHIKSWARKYCKVCWAYSCYSFWCAHIILIRPSNGTNNSWLVSLPF